MECPWSDPSVYYFQLFISLELFICLGKSLVSLHPSMPTAMVSNNYMVGQPPGFPVSAYVSKILIIYMHIHLILIFKSIICYINIYYFLHFVFQSLYFVWYLALSTFRKFSLALLFFLSASLCPKNNIQSSFLGIDIRAKHMKPRTILPLFTTGINC